MPQEKYQNIIIDKELVKYLSNNGKEKTFISKGKINFYDYSVK